MEKYCVHRYLTHCNTNPHPPGFGDFLRGTICLYNFSKKYNYKLLINRESHLIFNYFKNSEHYIFMSNINNCKFKDTPIELIEGNINFIEIYSRIEELFISKKNFLIITNSLYSFNNNMLVNYGDISQECKDFLRNILIPIDSIEKKIINVFNDIYKINVGDNYIIIHIRLKDDYTYNENIYNSIYNSIIGLISRNNNNYILMCSDSIIGLKLYNSIQGLHYWDNQKTHLGILNNKNGIEDTVIDFIIMSRSIEIISYSYYPWGSGFSKYISIIYDIRLTNLDI
jgi:hypothetical protein